MAAHQHNCTSLYTSLFPTDNSRPCNWWHSTIFPHQPWIWSRHSCMRQSRQCTHYHTANTPPCSRPWLGCYEGGGGLGGAAVWLALLSAHVRGLPLRHYLDAATSTKLPRALTQTLLTACAQGLPLHHWLLTAHVRGIPLRHCLDPATCVSTKACGGSPIGRWRANGLLWKVGAPCFNWSGLRKAAEPVHHWTYLLGL